MTLSTFRSRRLALLIPAAIFTLMFADCGHIASQPGRDSCPVLMQKWPSLDWAEAVMLQTTHYRVKTNAGQEAARTVGGMLEQALPLYCDLINTQSDQLLLDIYIYATLREYVQVAKTMGLPPYATTGLYSPEPPAAIHLPCQTRHNPCLTLLHEGMHQVTDTCLRFQVPGKTREKLSPARQQLTCAPLWLNEGLATYMEGAFTPAGDICPERTGWINPTRLKELKRLICARRCPALESVLSRPYGQPFSSRDYAVSWGIIYFLKHAPSQQAADGDNPFNRYLEACRQGFYNDPGTDFVLDFMPEKKLVDNFEQRWAEHIGRRSLSFFQDIFVGPGTSLDVWEDKFHNFFSHLDPIPRPNQ